MTLTRSNFSTLRVSVADMISLNVRAIGPSNLYQQIPEKGMTLMATMPRGSFPVSIPGAIDLDRGFPITKEGPSPGDGFTVVYVRKPNGRYEAVAVRYQANTFEIAKFIAFARSWVELNAGNIKAVPDRYAYVAPSRDEWGVILRDGGYTAWDTSTMPSEVSTELCASLQSQNSSGVIARIPVYAGEKQLRDEAPPVFTQVEVTLDSNPNPQSIWMNFDEYEDNRALVSEPPDSMIADFQEWLSLFAEESGFKNWIFDPGMSFGDHVEWWGDCSRRRTEHEGLDFAKGMQKGGGICSIPEGCLVRSIADGAVVSILDDYMGKTVLVRHDKITRSNGDVFHTIFSHIQPQVEKLNTVSKGQVLGRVGISSNIRTPSHLHLTGAWIPGNFAAEAIRMDHIHPAFAPIALANIKYLMRGHQL